MATTVLIQFVPKPNAAFSSPQYEGVLLSAHIMSRRFRGDNTQDEFLIISVLLRVSTNIYVKRVHISSEIGFYYYNGHCSPETYFGKSVTLQTLELVRQPAKATAAIKLPCITLDQAYITSVNPTFRKQNQLLFIIMQFVIGIVFLIR